VNQRGDISTDFMGDSLAAVSLGTGRSVRAAASGQSHSCVILDDGRLKCFGANNNGQLGQGDMSNRGDGPGEMGDSLAAVSLGTGRNATAVACGWYHSCVILDDGQLKCFGYNNYGQLGQGDTINRGDGPGEMGDSLAAVSLGTGRNATAVACGGYHSCVILDDGRLKCFGYNSYGQLGQGDTSNRGDGPGEMGDSLAAVSLGTGRTATAVACGGSTRA
jgi:E3 ubiquitin-protein ligase HERC3